MQQGPVQNTTTLVVVLGPQIWRAQLPTSTTLPASRTE